jgi:Zn-dependent peptidase ImmA (M78 family)
MYSSDTKYLLKQAGIEMNSNYYTSPISLRVFCEHFGLKYLKLPLDKNTCGMLVRSEDDKYIAINADHPYTRRRFSLAHEIGHYFLGHESEISFLNNQNRFEEIQANKYASSLLMPDKLFYSVHKDQFTIKAMANWLRVSPVAVAIRCLQFGIRKIEAERIKSDYYFALDEAVTVIPKSTQAQQQSVAADPSPEYEWRKPDPNEIKYQKIWEYNNDMIDKWRRRYGFE